MTLKKTNTKLTVDFKAAFFNILSFLLVCFSNQRPGLSSTVWPKRLMEIG